MTDNDIGVDELVKLMKADDSKGSATETNTEPTEKTQSDLEAPKSETKAIIPVLNQLISLSYALAVHYHLYGSSILSIGRDGIFDHFKEHVKDEQQVAYELIRKLISFQAPIQFDSIGNVHALSTDPKEQFKLLLLLESQKDELWNLLYKLTKDVGLQGFAQNWLVVTTAHAEDLVRYLQCIYHE
jgi:bacterioferritin (cytochrome b1)